MKIDGAPGYFPVKPHPTTRHPKPATSFKEAFDGVPVASSQHAVSFDGAGLLGLGSEARSEKMSTSGPQSAAHPPMAAMAADHDDRLETGVASGPASAASVMIAGGSAGNLPKPNLVAPPAGRHLPVAEQAAVAGAVVPGVSPPRGPLIVEPSGPAAPLPAQSLVSAKGSNGPWRAAAAEAPEPFSELKADNDPAGQQADGAADALSVIVSENNGDVQIIAAAPDVSDETRRQVREAAQDIARATGVRITGLSLNGAELIHNPELDRRTSWRSHQ